MYAATKAGMRALTIDLVKGYTDEGLDEVIENLYRFYPDPVEGEGEGEPVAEAAAASEPEPEPELEPATEP